MALNIQKELDDKRQLFVTVEVPEEQIQKEMKRLAREVAREFNFPGFRPGKAPYQLVVRQVGEERLRSEAAENLADDVFQEVMEQIEEEIFIRPVLEDIQLEPLQYKFLLPLAPEVDLGDYRSLRIPYEPVEVTDEAVEDALEHLRTHHETTEPVDRPAEEGDVIVIDGTAEYTDENGEVQTLFDSERLEYILDRETLFKGTSIVDELVGLETGDDKNFSITFPEDYSDESLAGREVHFDVTVLDVLERDRPELDDELAKLEGAYETLDELRQAMREQLVRQAETQARNDFSDEMVKRLREGATLNYPPATVESELEDLLNERKQLVERSGWDWEEYLAMQEQTEEELREQLHERAIQRAEDKVVLRQFVLNERLMLGDADLDEAIDERLANFEDEELREGLRSYWRGPGLDQLMGTLLMDKIVERMRAIAAGEAPDLDAVAEEEEIPVAEEAEEEATETEETEFAPAEDETAETETNEPETETAEEEQEPAE